MGLALVAALCAEDAMAILQLNGKYSGDRYSYKIFDARCLNPKFHVFYDKPLVEYDNVDGLSAYEIVVKYGYTGTELEFAESLKDVASDIKDVRIDGESVVTNKVANINSSLFGNVNDVTVDDVSIVENKVAKLESTAFGKVDDIKLDGTSIVVDKVAELSSDSFGKVKDVKVNGTTVLGTDGIANVTVPSIPELKEYIKRVTIAEYEALEAAGTVDMSTVYVITDDDTPYFKLSGTEYLPIDDVYAYVSLIYTDVNDRLIALENALVSSVSTASVIAESDIALESDDTI